MSEFVNDRDIFLVAQGNLNLGPRDDKDLLLDVDPVAFHTSAEGLVTPALATFTVTTIGFKAVATWAISTGGILTGSLPNIRTLAAANMSEVGVQVTATAVYNGERYSKTKTIFKVSDGKNGMDADPANLSPEALVAALEGRITNSQLNADLRSKISLITDPVSVPGSVQALIKAETDGRVAAIGAEVQTRQQAISKEVDDRIAAVLAETDARTTYIQNYTFSQQAISSALSIQATQIVAGYTAYTDQKTGGILSTAAADVRNYSYSKADTTSAISASESRLRSEFNAAGGVTQADIESWSYSKAATDSAEAAQTATLTTSFQGYADQKKSEAMTASAADVRNYAYGKSTVDAAEAAQSATLTTNYTAYADAARTSAVSTASADVRQYTYSKSTVDSSISAAIQQLRSEFVGSSGATEGYVTNYAYSKAQIDQAEALQSSTLTTNYQKYAGEIGDQVLTATYADVRQYAYSKSDTNGAISSLSTQLTASYQNYANQIGDQVLAAGSADVRSYSVAKADLAGAIAQSTSSLSTTVGQHTAAIQSQFTSLDGLSAQLTWKIDNNGHVSGFGLASTPINGVPYSTMIFNVDVLGVALPGGTGKPIFTVGQVNGQPQAVFRSDLFVDGGIRASALAIGNSDQVVPDSQMADSAWWARQDQFFGVAGPNGFWHSNRILSFGAGYAYADTFTAFFPVVRGGVYLFEFQVYMTDDYAGPCAVYAHLPGQEWLQMGVESRGYSFAQAGIPGGSDTVVTFDENSVKGTRVPNAIRTINDDVNGGRVQFRIITNVTRGVIQFGGFRVTRIMDSVLIAEGAITAGKVRAKAITADKIDVYSLQAISNVVIGRNGLPYGTELDVNGGRVYDTNGVRRFQFGNLDV